MTTKTLLICLDSADPMLAERWMRESHLPNLLRLSEQGTAYDVRNVRGFGNGAFWPSFVTGLEPGEHGRYAWVQLKTGSYRLERFDPRYDFNGRPFWAEIDARGGKVASIDIMRSPPADLVNGIEVVDWLAHDPECVPFSKPARLIDDLHETYGKDPFGTGCDSFIKATGDYSLLLKHALARIGWKTDFCCKSLSADAWDFFAVAFTELHDIGHMCWHIHDPLHVRHDADLRGKIGDPLLLTFRHLDEAVGRLLEAAGSDASIVVVSGPGFETLKSSNALLPIILERWENGTSATKDPQGSAATLESFVRKGYHLLVPAKLRRVIYRCQKAIRGSKEERAWARSRAFALTHNDHAGAIRINLRGREPNGKIEPGAECESVIEDLCATLIELRDLESNVPLVREIVRVDEVTRGNRSGGLPDLFVVWNREASGESAASPRIGEIHCPSSSLRTGDHTDRCQLLVANARVRLRSHDVPITPMDAGLMVKNLADTML